MREALDFLYSFLPTNTEERYPKEVGLARQQRFLELIGNPQHHVKVIHIAGTTGKGSTAWYIQSLLLGLGQTVGLHISPHLVDIRERARVNGALLEESIFCRYLTELIPAIRQLCYSKYGRPTYFQILVSLALYAFYRQHVTYAVMETGVGGMLDATNAVKNADKVAVLTRIGKDHTAVLGKLIVQIARQKALIMHKGNHGFYISQGKRVNTVFEDIALSQGAKIQKIDKKNVHIRHFDQHTITYDLDIGSERLKSISLPTPARYQVENSALAIAVVYYISRRDSILWDIDTIRRTLAHTHVAGRMQILTVRGRTVILDAAHNPQKMHGLLTSLTRTWPGQRFSFVLAFKKGKDYSAMMRLILPHAAAVTVSSFSQSAAGAPSSHDPRSLSHEIEQETSVPVSQAMDSHTALESAMHQGKGPVVVTGSIYFLSEIYRYIRELSVDNTTFI